MPLQLYTQKEFTKCNLERSVYSSLLMQIASQHKDKFNNRDILNKFHKKHKGSYHYIPIDLHYFFTQITFVKSYILKTEKTNSVYDKEFVDAGCGFPLNLMVARLMNFTTTGFEIDKQFLIPEYKKFGVKKQNILTADYTKFDVIYFYCPFDDSKLEIEFENRVIEQCKVGGIIIANLKREMSLDTNDNYKQLSPKFRGTIFQRIK